MFSGIAKGRLLDLLWKDQIRKPMYLLALKDKVSVDIDGYLDSTLANLVPKTNISTRMGPTQTYIPPSFRGYSG